MRYIFLIFFVATAFGEVTFDTRYSSHMVLQREREIPVVGTGEPGANIEVTLNGQTSKATVQSDRSWRVSFPPQVAGGPYKLSAKDGNSEVVLDDVLIGDVWVASGQSNMELQVRYTPQAESLKSDPGPSTLRLGSVAYLVADSPQDTAKINWSICSPNDVQRFSGVGYFFGRKLVEEIKIPIGIINVSVGGTPIEAWMNIDILKSSPEFMPIVSRWQNILEAYPAARQEWDKVSDQEREAKYQQRLAKALERGEPKPYRQEPPIGPGNRSTPSGLWNGMIYPITTMPIKGVIWYQGESNAGRAEQYAKLFPALIQDWRRQWGQGDFPFYFVQLPNFNAFRKQVDYPVESSWAELREAQAQALSVPRTAMAVTIDVGEADQIHPKDKKSVGDRLARIALKNDYQFDVVCNGPRFLKVSKDGENVMVEFDPSTGKLVTRNGEPVKAVAVAGADHKFVWADAEIAGPNALLVKKPVNVTKIESVRYNWGDTPNGNIYNEAGLPAEPFRTDTWPGVTAGKR